MMLYLRVLTFALLVLAGGNVLRSKELHFERDVYPILKAHCLHCHGEQQLREGGLDLRLRRFLADGGESGPAIAVGKPADSLLVRRLRDGEMPPDDLAKLSNDDIATIETWIQQGAPTAHPEPETIGDEPIFTVEEKQFWAFQPIQQPPLPLAEMAVESRGPVDLFLAEQLRNKGLAFSPTADAVTLVRRATFDLTGLPPTPDEIHAFERDERPDAFERLTDRLLASPRYGERWGRHWLDVAGYADSEGYTDQDTVRPWAFRYRDYVIRSLNDDKPLDQFIQEQLAGDEMVSPPHKNLAPQQLEKLVATGFLRMAPDGTGTAGVDENVARNEVMADTIKIVSTSLLGLTVGCARCHNHRYDPIDQSDYYRMRAIFEPAYDWKHWRVPRARLISLYTDDDRVQAAQIEEEAKKIDEQRTKKQEEYIARTFEKELAKLPEALREPIRSARATPAKEQTEKQKSLLKKHPSVNVTAGSLYLYDNKAAQDLKQMVEQATKLRGTKPKEEFIRVLTEPTGRTPPETFLFARGDHEQPKQAVPAAELTILNHSSGGQLPANDPELATTGRRLAYARHLTSGLHPLTTRVLVNRFWMHHFGRGIVGSPGEFGFLGQRPTHPQLLDWLARDFSQHGWQLKRLHRLLMTSTAYRQSSRRNDQLNTVDPDNLLYARMPLRRLEAEAVRDSVLSVSGRLFEKMLGEPVPVMEDEVGQIVIGKENLDGERKPTKKVSLNGDEFRRSVYIQVRRSRPLGVLETFDTPAMTPNCDARNSSNVAPQSLLWMNSDFAVAYAEHFARRVIADVGDDPPSRIRRMWQLALGRDASTAEIAGAREYLSKQQVEFEKHEAKSGELHALTSLCQALMSTNRFLYVE